MKAGAARWRIAAFAALIAAAGASPAAQGDERPIRQRQLAGWSIEDAGEADGGRIVRMTRSSAGARMQFTAAFWHGNDGRIQTVLVERSDCTDGDELGRHQPADAAAVRARLASALASCALTPREIEAALAGLEPAYALASRWADEAAEATAAEARAIADHGSDASAQDMVVIEDAEPATGNTTAPDPQ